MSELLNKAVFNVQEGHNFFVLVKHRSCLAGMIRMRCCTKYICFHKNSTGFSEGSLVNLFSFSINSIIFMDIMLGQGQVGKRQKKAAEDPRPHIQMTTVCLLQPRNYGQSSHSQG